MKLDAPGALNLGAARGSYEKIGEPSQLVAQWCSWLCGHHSICGCPVWPYLLHGFFISVCAGVILVSLERWRRRASYRFTCLPLDYERDATGRFARWCLILAIRVCGLRLSWVWVLFAMYANFSSHGLAFFTESKSTVSLAQVHSTLR